MNTTNQTMQNMGQLANQTVEHLQQGANQSTEYFKKMLVMVTPPSVKEQRKLEKTLLKLQKNSLILLAKNSMI